MRFLTFRFDDGLISGAQKAVRALAPDKASFFVLSRPEALKSGPYANLTTNAAFGSREDWRRLADSGQDIQPHSATHPNFLQISEEQATQEIADSLTYVRGIHSGPYIFSFPFNQIPASRDLASLGLDGAGFVATTSADPVNYQMLENASLDRFRLKAWQVYEEHYDVVVAALAELPQRSWTILGFHSFDGEGWKPWSLEAFTQLVAHVRDAGFTIVNVREMFEILACQEAT